MNDNPMEKLSKLRARVAEISASLGLELEGFMVMPDANEDGLHVAQAVFHLDPVKAFGVVDQAEFDRQFEAIAMAEQVSDEDQQIVDIRAKLAESLAALKPGEGIGLDEADS